jgi:hypothetical protein
MARKASASGEYYIGRWRIKVRQMANRRQGRAEARDDLVPGAFSGTEAAFQMTAQQIAEEIRKVDLDQVRTLVCARSCR